MIISIKNKYIFISNPKTGSQSIRDFLKENDKTTYWNNFTYKGKNYFITEHARARDIKSIMGSHYEDFYVFTFIRDPYKKAVSGYYFYRNGKFNRNYNKSLKFKIIRSLNLLEAKILPFKLWLFFKPLKSNFEYVTDLNGQIIVDYIGLTYNTAKDMDKIFKKLNLRFKGKDIIKKNVSSYQRKKEYFSGSVKKYFDLKYKKDIELYQNLKRKK